MMKAIGTFPFGQPVRILAQVDRAPKRVFVLGVYASAVHARWVGYHDEVIVRALAVASEPEIFWRGEGADSIIRGIEIPDGPGRLEAASRQYNGPSGIALDESFLQPLGLTRHDAWLCDLVPHSCMNPAQDKAIEREYLPRMRQYHLPKAAVPAVPKRLSDGPRQKAIVEEIHESEADVLILLGDQPIRWFLRFYDARWRRLSDFGADPGSYGRLHDVTISGRKVCVLPLAHARQVARLGRSSSLWYSLHQSWLDERAHRLLGS